MQKRILPSQIKAIALDLDGTALTPKNILSDRTINVLKVCLARGIAIIISTGRPAGAAEKFRTAIGSEGPMVYYNGAEVMDMPSQKVLSVTPLPLAVVNYCTEIARSMDVHYQAYFSGYRAEVGAEAGAETGTEAAEVLLIEKTRPESEMYRNHTGFVPLTGDLAKATAQPGIRCIKSMFVTEAEAQDRIRPLLAERFGNTIYVARTNPVFLEIMAAGVSKGEGLKTAMKARGLKAEEVIALGDEENDLPMFTAAAFAAAPANAKEKVKDMADLVIGPNSEDGVAEFIEKKILAK
jgi:Cof subfamily protein (haloacid dehalogenase superfamily)